MASSGLGIVERFENGGTTIREVVICGGIAERIQCLVQVCADVCSRPGRVSQSARAARASCELPRGVVHTAKDEGRQASSVSFTPQRSS